MFRLGILDDDDARSLLAHRLGPQRVAAEPEAMVELLGRCVGLPLALGIVASRAAAQPSSPLQGWARELRDTATRLGAFDAGDPQSSVRATIAWSHAALPQAQADLFALLSSAPGPDIDVAAVTCALGSTSDQAWALLRALTRVSLLDEHVPGRFRMHDLVRLYGLEHRGPDHDTALCRLVTHYVYLTNPVWLARALNSVGWYQARLGRPHHGLQPCAQALDLFQRNRDVGGEAATLDTLGLIAHHSGDHAHALNHHRAALTLFRRLGNHYLEADTLVNIANAHAAQGETRHARDISQQALQLYRRQGRPADAARVQQQLDSVVRAGGDQPGTVPSSVVPVRHGPAEVRRDGRCE